VILKIQTFLHLAEWVEYWRHEFGAVAHRIYGDVVITEPIDEQWIRIIDLLEEQAERYDALIESGKRKTKTNPPQEMLDKLLGPQLLKYASDEYWQTASMIQVGLSEWRQMSLKERGRIIAYNRIHNAIEGMTRYATELKMNSEREKQKKSQAKAPRSRGRRR